MTKDVIHIFGASGSGTTTLAKHICERMGYTHMDTDDYFWLPSDPPYTLKRDARERLEMMESDLRRARGAVISGSLTDWGDPLIPRFTLAVRLATDTRVRIARIREREKRMFGARIQPGGDMYQNHLDFLDFAASYDLGDESIRSKAKHDKWQTLLKCDILTLDGADALERNYDIVARRLDKRL